MKVLVCIPHFFDRSKSRHAVLGSSQDSAHQRAMTVDYCLRQLLSLLSEKRFLLGTETGGKNAVVNTDVKAVTSDVSGDVFVMTYQEEHLLDMLTVRGYYNVKTAVSDPIYLGYACRKMFAELKDKYDLFFYVEDDITPLDASFFKKAFQFYEVAGTQTVVTPQRFELFGNLSIKSYLDHPTPPHYRVKSEIKAAEQIALPSFDGSVKFDLTTSWGNGCFLITREHLHAWMKYRDFFAPRSGMGMMTIEQAMLPMLGRYPMYRTAIQNLDFLEVHHVPNRACHAKTPFGMIRDLLAKN